MPLINRRLVRWYVADADSTPQRLNQRWCLIQRPFSGYNLLIILANLNKIKAKLGLFPNKIKQRAHSGGNFFAADNYADRLAVFAV